MCSAVEAALIDLSAIGGIVEASDVAILGAGGQYVARMLTLLVENSGFAKKQFVALDFGKNRWTWIGVIVVGHAIRNP